MGPPLIPATLEAEAGGQNVRLSGQLPETLSNNVFKKEQSYSSVVVFC